LTVEDHRRDIAAFRYALIRVAADPLTTPRQRGALVRALARQDHLGPDGTRVRVSRSTLDRWIKAWCAGGFDALMPPLRDGVPTTDKDLLELAENLKREVPARTGAHIAAMIAEAKGTAPSERTIQRHLARLGLNLIPACIPKVYGRFEAEVRNELWTGDVLHGPVVAGRKTYLFAFIDDHSRALVGYRFGHAEDVLRLEAAFRAGMSSRGVPSSIFVDNGSPYVSRWLLRACGVLGIILVHSKPGEPASRGKIERVFSTVRSQFLVEAEHRGAADLAELNALFAAWVETVYHHRIHSETGQAPLERFLAAGPPALPTPAELRKAFLWSEIRSVTKTATVNLYGNRYEVAQHLVGARVELVFDPFDLADILVRHRGRDVGPAVPHTISRHTHPKAKPEQPSPPRPTGIDYLKLVKERFDDTTRRRISYSDLPPETNGDGTQPDGEPEEEAR
jgi:putative transposase